MKNNGLIVMCFFVLFVSACGKSEEEKMVEEERQVSVNNVSSLDSYAIKHEEVRFGLTKTYLYELTESEPSQGSINAIKEASFATRPITRGAHNGGVSIYIFPNGSSIPKLTGVQSHFDVVDALYESDKYPPWRFVYTRYAMSDEDEWVDCSDVSTEKDLIESFCK